MPRLRGKRWQADARLSDGTRLRRSFHTKGEAEAFEAKPSAGLDLDTLFEAAYELYWRRSANARTARTNMLQIKEFFGPQSSPAVITTARIRDFVTHLRNQGNADSTINRKLVCLGKLTMYCITQGVMEHRPLIEFFKEYGDRTRFFTEEEEARLLSNLTPRHAALCTFMLYTGCRLGEALRLQWQDITPKGVTFWKTKGNKPRTVPLTSKARKALEVAKSLSETQLVWPIDYNELNYDWNRARELAGLKGDKEAVIHTLRHTCASRLVQGGMDMRRLMMWLGHRNINTTMRYAHLAPDDLVVGTSILDGTVGHDVAQVVSLSDSPSGHSHLPSHHRIEVSHVREEVRDRPADLKLSLK